LLLLFENPGLSGVFVFPALTSGIPFSAEINRFPTSSGVSGQLALAEYT